MQASRTPHASPEHPQQLTLIWESELVQRGDGRVELVARKPLSEMSVKRTARVLGVSKWTVTDLYRLGLIKGRKPGPLKKSGKHQRMIPVIGWAHAGAAERYEQKPESWQHLIPTECRDEKAFAVELEGDSMEPKFSEGDTLVLQPSETAHSGSLVVARFRDDGVIFRRFETAGKMIIMVPLNPRYQSSTHDIEEFSWIYPVWGRWTQIWR